MRGEEPGEDEEGGGWKGSIETRVPHGGEEGVKEKTEYTAMSWVFFWGF